MSTIPLTIPLNLQDSTFLAVETQDYPTHVAGLQIFEMRERDPQFLRALVDDLVRAPVAPFWRRVLQPGALGPIAGARWRVADDIDLDLHVRHVALPEPGSMAQLERLVERLHRQPLDRSRPLWECWFIEGLGPKRFAIYTKVHHAMIDGMGGVQLALAAMSTERDEAPRAPWSLDLPARPKPAEAGDPRPLRRGLGTLGELYREGARQALDWTSRAAGLHERVDLPFAAPRAPFNGRVDGYRRFATRSLSLVQMKCVAKAMNVTLNDVVLALTGGALRRWLGEQDALPERSLVASCPVSVRAADGSGNNLSALLAELGTDEADPLARLQRVGESTARGKRAVSRLSRGAAEGWALAVGVAGLVPALVNEGRTLPPAANLVVSNVPGPRERRYYAGAEMVGYYPVSILTHGQGLNVTVLSRATSVDFGVTASRASCRTCRASATRSSWNSTPSSKGCSRTSNGGVR